MNETSTRKGRKYGTVFLEITGKDTHCRSHGEAKVARLLFFTPGKGKETASECGGQPRGAMWALRRNPENLKDTQRQFREQICKEHGRIERAISIKEFLADTWNYQLLEGTQEHLKSVISWCVRSRMLLFVKLGKAHGRHMDGILGYFKKYTTSAVIESINGLLQLARRRARGYRTFRNFQAMAYWISGG